MLRENFNMQTEVVASEDGLNTYEIRRIWSDKGKKSLVVEMYPTICAEKCGTLDLSTMHLLNHAEELGWGETRIVNIYSKVFHSKPPVSQLEDDEKNLAYIEEILDEEDISEYDIVIAWGNSMSTHAKTTNAKIDILNMIKKRGLEGQVKCLVTDNLVTEKICGVHPLFLGLHYAKDEWKLMKYPVGEIAQELENSLVKKPLEEPKKKGRKKDTTKNQG